MPPSSNIRGGSAPNALAPGANASSVGTNRDGTAQAPAATPATNTNGEWQAEKLTGVRATRGSLPNNGGPRWVYEVKWAGINPATKKPWPTSFESAANLVGWDKEMKEIDELLRSKEQAPALNPARAARLAREEAAKAKAEELKKKKERLKRRQVRALPPFDSRLALLRYECYSCAFLQARAAARGNEVDDDDEFDDESSDEDECELEGAELASEVLRLEQLEKKATRTFNQLGGPTREQIEELLTLLSGDGAAVQQAMDAVQGQVGDAADEPKASRRREATSIVWLAFDKATNRCKLPHPMYPGEKCLAPPSKGTGTSGHRRHLEKCHAEEWASIRQNGCMPVSATINAALRAKTDQSKQSLPEKDTAEIHRLLALWVAKCGRPLGIVGDKELQLALTRLLELSKSRYRFNLPTELTIKRHLQLLGAEGKAIARDFCSNLIKSGIKISITGDLWSSGGMGLFGIYAHGIVEKTAAGPDGTDKVTWEVSKALIGLVSCEQAHKTL